MNRAIKGEELKKTVALYAGHRGYVTVHERCNWIDEHSDYVRVSENREIEFVPLADQVVLKNRVKSIDKQIEGARAELTRRIADLTDQKQRLLAIAHQQDIA